jgi:hypothetical protein
MLKLQLIKKIMNLKKETIPRKKIRKKMRR